MKKHLVTWLIPIAAAIILVLIARFLLLRTVIITDDSMSDTFFEADKVLCFNFVKKTRNSIVLCEMEPGSGTWYLKRQVAIPGDTLKIYHSIIYINSMRISDDEGIAYNYSFTTDSVREIYDYLKNSDVKFDFKKSYLGAFSGIFTLKNLKKIHSNQSVVNIKRDYKKPYITSLSKTFGGDLYWNTDNLGPIIIPKKGMKIKLGRKAVFLYKQIIENESGKKISIKNNFFFLDSQKIENYTFKKDYYFLLNDNRSNTNDSRKFGFVAEDKIIGSYLSKLPW